MYPYPHESQSLYNQAFRKLHLRTTYERMKEAWDFGEHRLRSRFTRERRGKSKRGP
jgi:hypothetical protein